MQADFKLLSVQGSTIQHLFFHLPQESYAVPGYSK